MRKTTNELVHLGSNIDQYTHLLVQKVKDRKLFGNPTPRRQQYRESPPFFFISEEKLRNTNNGFLHTYYESLIRVFIGDIRALLVSLGIDAQAINDIGSLTYYDIVDQVQAALREKSYIPERVKDYCKHSIKERKFLRHEILARHIIRESEQEWLPIGSLLPPDLSDDEWTEMNYDVDLVSSLFQTNYLSQSQFVDNKLMRFDDFLIQDYIFDRLEVSDRMQNLYGHYKQISPLHPFKYPMRYLKNMFMNKYSGALYTQSRHDIGTLSGKMKVLSPLLGQDPVQLDVQITFFKRWGPKSSLQDLPVETWLRFKMPGEPFTRGLDDGVNIPEPAKQVSSEYFPHTSSLYERLYYLLHQKILDHLEELLNLKGFASIFESSQTTGKTYSVHLKHSAKDHLQEGHDLYQEWSTNANIPETYLYQGRGAQRFLDITHTPDYGVSTGEKSILEKHVLDILSIAQPQSIVDLGCGDGEKGKNLLETMLQQKNNKKPHPIQNNQSEEDATYPIYVAFDVSPVMLAKALNNVNSTVPRKELNHAQTTGYEGVFDQIPGDIKKIPHKLLLFLGNTLGNFSPERQLGIITHAASLMDKDDSLLIGIDLRFDPEELTKAYNTPEANSFFLGFLQEHLWNQQEKINELVDISQNFEGEKQQIISTVTFRRNCAFRLRTNPNPILYTAGETIHMGISQKYKMDHFEKMIEKAGLKIVQPYFDDQKNFGVYLLQLQEKK